MEGNPIILNKCIERSANLAIRDISKGIFVRNHLEAYINHYYVNRCSTL